MPSDKILHHTFDAGEGVLIPAEILEHVVLDELPKRLDDTGACIGRIGVLTRLGAASPLYEPPARSNAASAAPFSSS